jgi:CheY-like chemotaxis protein
MLLPNRALLADDDREVRQGLAELLAPFGLECLHAESGPEALEIASLRLPHLALMVLDLHMPGCSGLEVLKGLRTRTPDLWVPCIFYSGEVAESVQRQALEAGAWAFLRKPVQPDLLRVEVQRALVHAHAPRQRPPPRSGPLP